MFTRSYWHQRDFPLFHTENDGKDAAGNPVPPATPPAPKGENPDPPVNPAPPAPAGFTKEQQEFIDKLVGDARVEGKNKAKQEADDAKKKADDDKAQADLIAKGEFETAKTNYETTISGLQTDVKTRDELIEKYEKLAADQVTAKREELELPKEWMEGYPEKGTPIDQLAYLTEREKLWKAAHPETGDPANPAKPANPRPPSTPAAPTNGAKKQLTDAELQKKQEQYRRQSGRNW